MSEAFVESLLKKLEETERERKKLREEVVRLKAELDDFTLKHYEEMDDYRLELNEARTNAADWKRLYLEVRAEIVSNTETLKATVGRLLKVIGQ